MKAGILLIFLIGANLSANAQNACKPEVDYSFKETFPGSYSIYLKGTSLASNKPAEVTLYDLSSDKVVQTKQLSSVRRQQEVFTRVKPSRYIIYIKLEGCENRSIGGISGIKIGSTE